MFISTHINLGHPPPPVRAARRNIDHHAQRHMCTYAQNSYAVGRSAIRVIHGGREPRVSALTPSATSLTLLVR